MADLVDSVRAAVSDRADLPGMSLMEHLTELRKRLIHSTVYLMIGFCIAYAFHVRLYGIIQKPLNDLHIALNYTHPTDPLNLYLKTALYGGIILASPFILYQLWLFIAPGMYANEKRYVVPFMSATIVLFLSGAWFGYHWVFPGALKVLIGGFGKNFNPVLTIEDYTNFFLAVILGLGVTFELPILIFFLALFGIVDAKFLVQHIRYAILAIFIIAAIICPTPDPIGMCLFASPMLVLYLIGVGIAFLVHPARRKAREANKAA
ncbi:twin-arginine translocase subunit TatC [Tunturiibacter lichenicola]|uniref:twin-arginine translocase subunit TatC n=1 Tax=Tunturiibacter lichenicola TaxID=2051959 RepID=UPI003D9AD66E